MDNKVNCKYRDNPEQIDALASCKKEWTKEELNKYLQKTGKPHKKCICEYELNCPARDPRLE
jgi:hypothetical protein